jgi:hypothetical protein
VRSDIESSNRIKEHSMKRFSAGIALAILVLGLVTFRASDASAHEHRVVAGKYTFIVGWSDEPAYTTFKNGLDLRVTENTGTPTAGGESEGTPVEGLDQTLQAEVIYGDQKMPLTLEPRWNTPGAYDGWVVPIAAGDYSFHIWGTINGDAVDETFTAGPETFSSVIDVTTIQFPSASAQNSGIVAGTVGGDNGGSSSGGLLAGILGGVALGAGSLWLIQRRRTNAPRRTLAPTMGIGTSAGD